MGESDWESTCPGCGAEKKGGETERAFTCGSYHPYPNQDFLRGTSECYERQLTAAQLWREKAERLLNELRQLATDCMQCRHWSFHKAGELTDRVDAFNDEGVTMRTPENKVDAC